METLPLDYADDGSSYCDFTCGPDCDCRCHGDDDDYDTSFYDQQPDPFNVTMLTPATAIITPSCDDEDPVAPNAHLEEAADPR